jgi:hypothetical protein
MAAEPFGLAQRGLGIPEHDHISLTYSNGQVSQVVYKAGGEFGNTVATLTLTYSNGLLATVTKS